MSIKGLRKGWYYNLILLLGILGLLDTIVVICFGGGINLGTVLPAIMGLGFLALGCWGYRIDRKAILERFPVSSRLVASSIILLISSFVIIEGLIIWNTADTLPDEVDYILILGAGLNGDQLSWSLRERVDKGIELLNQNPNAKAVVSGGQGPGERLTEAEAMARYMLQNGIREDRIIKEEKSTSTMENFLYSKELLQLEEDFDMADPILVITNDFHVFRSKILAKRNGFNPLGVPCYTPWYIRPNVYLREYFAMVKSLLIDR